MASKVFIILLTVISVCHVCMADEDRDDHRDARLISPIEPHWYSWQHWHSCSVSCGGGIQIRHRTCHFPHHIPELGFCQGSSTEERTCSDPPCTTGSF